MPLAQNYKDDVSILEAAAALNKTKKSIVNVKAKQTGNVSVQMLLKLSDDDKFAFSD